MKKESEKLNKIILFYNPNSGSGMFKNNLDYIIGRCQDAGYLVVPVRAAHGTVIADFLAVISREGTQLPEAMAPSMYVLTL